MNFRNLFRVQNYPRYLRYAPNYLSGVAEGKTIWGDRMNFVFPEFRSIMDKGIIDHAGDVALMSYLWDTLTPADTYFDIGANAGFYALLAHRKGATVHAFEPFPSTFQILRKNCEGKNIFAWNLAMSDSNEGVYMKRDERYPDFSGWNAVSPDGDIPVASTSLDQFSIVPTVMKVDVEGHEMQVFRGAQKMLKKYHPKIIAEGNGEADFLFSLGYTKIELLGNERSTNYLFT
jgi:FkbM family methyltransferase